MKNNTLSDLIDALPELARFHSNGTKTYKLLKSLLKDLTDSFNLISQNACIPFDQFRKVNLPYQQMGAISSIDLLGIDELIIFAFYWKNRYYYKNVADLGANIGLHSIILSRCGYNVTCYEPDPLHFEILQRNLKINEVFDVEHNNYAVSDKEGFERFVRVVGNTTSSHLEGSKDNAYGELDIFEVQTVHIDSVFEGRDFIKMDVEGAEGKIIQATTREHWSKTEMILEVGNAKTASAIFDHLNKLGVNSFSQKRGWALVKSLEDVPTSFKEGSLFISKEDVMRWL